MNIGITNFWNKENKDRPQLTEEMIAFAEESLHVKLPQLFIELLTIQNGGYTNGFVFPMTQSSWSPNHIPLFEL